ncbi:hypothetical protein MGSAQ_000177 [marine sediment metagenome]|uniref:Uncharacterized protein n=1 Tax=marine sediment metagenome TaxID=412755 RepID=A0A1B6NZ36_9ZZZZ
MPRLSRLSDHFLSAKRERQVLSYFSLHVSSEKRQISIGKKQKLIEKQ